MHGTVQDVTERMQIAEALRIADEQLDLAIRGSNLGIWDFDVAPGSDYRCEAVRFINVWEQLGARLGFIPQAHPSPDHPWWRSEKYGKMQVISQKCQDCPSD